MDFSMVPLWALSTKSKIIISTLLNPPKILPADNGLLRDWRGLVQLFEIASESIPLLANISNPSDRILDMINDKVTLEELQNAFEKIERWDVLNDTETQFEKDAEEYAEKLKNSQQSAELIYPNVELQLLTIDDEYRSRIGLEAQHYDAFILYADEDYDFAKEMIERLEKENMKICTKDRDLLAGTTIESEVIMKLISERCNRLIVIISPNFLSSSENSFFLEFGHAVGIEQRKRKLIACIYKNCEKLPDSLKYLLKINYGRREYFDFWTRLCDSVRISPVTQKSQLESKENKIEETDLTLYNYIDKEKQNKNQLALTSQLSKCSEPTSKSHAILRKLARRQDKKLKSPGTSREIIDEQVNDSGISLPSIPSDSISFTSDATNLLSLKNDKKKKLLAIKLPFGKKK